MPRRSGHPLGLASVPDGADRIDPYREPKERNTMWNRWTFLAVGLFAGLGLGAVIFLCVRSAGVFSGPNPSFASEPHRSSSQFVHSYSLPVAAKELLPAVPWEVLQNGTRETYLFSSTGARRAGARIRCITVRNDMNQPVSGDEQAALHARLLDGIAEQLRAENIEVFDSSVTQSDTAHIRPSGPRDVTAKPPAGTNPRRFFSGQIAYRTNGVEGRVYTSTAGEGDTAVTLSVVIVEQPSESNFDTLK